MVPVMYFVAGTLREKPQQTHKWNNKKLSRKEANSLDASLMTSVAGVPCKIKKQGGILFHIPIIGGWREYVVLTPRRPEDGWHVGWHNEEVTGVSRIRLTTPVRLLVGPNDISFFGISSTGEQIHISEIGCGRVGENLPQARQHPLL